jgi:hypothetical protein
VKRVQSSDSSPLTDEESRRSAEEHAATGIYGTIVSGGVMAAAHLDRAATLTIAVVGTLLIYWTAERYSRLVAERIHGGERPTWAHVREHLTSGWVFVTASFVPLGVLLLARLAGSDMDTAVLAGLCASVVLLFLQGWRIGASGHLDRSERLFVAAAAAAFGLLLIALKSLLH